MRFLLLVLLAAAASCGSTSPDPVPDSDLRILFIGNSLTYANNLPSMVEQLGRSEPSRTVVVSSVAFGDYSLEDHWNRGDALTAIKSDKWDFVLLQQGPSALPESRTNLIEWSSKFAAEIRRVGATPVLYMVWPGLDRESEWDAVTESYTAAASASHSLVFPAGEALRSAYTADPTLALFENDRFHPTRLGSYGVALVVYAMASHTSPVGLTLRAGGSTLLPGQVAALEAAAADAIDRFGSP